ncbi:hypothetical protein ZIOFF_056698 [Zingiber officinale]|uniref:Uncharacterized protein n=1 Tax=Zingiber officinale TaxID=94328 RepID=A0A8J5FGL6_ZINOF|nr:hypothetical protein ZIOFF_056698 [Zingiber officinale]
MTRPDITYAVSVVSQYMHAPKTIHMKAVDRILRYLKSCPGKGLLFKGGGDMKVVIHLHQLISIVPSTSKTNSAENFAPYAKGSIAMTIDPDVPTM